MRFVGFPTLRSETYLAVALLGSARLQASGLNVWITTDSPIEEQMPRKFLFALKKILISEEWGYDPGCVYADVDGPFKTLKVKRKEVLRVSVVDGELCLLWESAWKNWIELHDSQEMKTLIEKISKMGKGGGKGKGKAKYGY